VCLNPRAMRMKRRILYFWAATRLLMFLFDGKYYLIILVLQAICVWHCVRRGRQNNWIWLIVFLPLVGCLIYIFSEMFTRRDVEKMQSGVGAVFNPGGTIRRLESNLRFSDTFANRIALADALLEAGQTARAIELYESSLEGNFTENEYVLGQLIIAYFQQRRYEEIIPLAKKIYKVPQFARSRAHILYATALGYAGQIESAEKEFRTMKTKFSDYEARYRYGQLLAATQREQEAKQLFHEILNEQSHLSPQEKRYNRQWFLLVKEELNKVKSKPAKTDPVYSK
jgi:hypothetical protein